jgi:hypothetical protein
MQDTFSPGEAGPTPTYPVRLTMAYPEKLSRLSTFFRLILVIPVLFFLILLSGQSFQWFSTNESARNVSLGGAGGIIAGIWAAIIVRGRIPHWLFDFQVAFHRFSYRAYAYLGLLTDKYPAFEGDWELQYDVDYPEGISRWRILFWKLITAIPHFIVLAFLTIAVFFVTFIAWFAILFTGQYPRGLHKFSVGVLRWGARVTAYFESLTDVFPPFSLDENAGPGGSQAISAVIGGVIVAAVIAGTAALGAFLYVYFNESKTSDETYANALRGDLDRAALTIDDVSFTLTGGDDDATVDLIRAPVGKRLVVFQLEYDSDRRTAFNRNDDNDPNRIDKDAVRLKTDAHGSVSPVLLTFDRQVTPLRVPDGAQGELYAVFEIDEEDEVLAVGAYPNAGNERHVAWEFE